MSVFGNMFDEDNVDVVETNKGENGYEINEGVVGSHAGRSETQSTRSSCPPRQRPSHGLCGIVNRGATCYLNSLLQTLAMTPEFQSGLLRLSPNELGQLADVRTKGSKVRIIPIQLQRLLAQLLLLDVDAVNTDELTSSFGWTNNEERDQHDIQELNRILFSAVEESLIGTSGQDLIRDLYHGSMVNKIQCIQCGHVSERVEDFLDLCVSTCGSSCLEDSLARLFLEQEMLDSSNQYHCGDCKNLSDAIKTTSLRHLPPILTVSILRFNFDPVKLERFKETGRFEFPLMLDMSRYCESSVKCGIPKSECIPSACGESATSNSVPAVDGREARTSGDCGDVAHGDKICDATYELFSVIVHRGGAHGGHYHALIRDIEGRGKWTQPDVPKQTAKANKAAPSTAAAQTNNTEEILDCSSPQAVISAILRKCGKSSGLTMDSLCSEMTTLTGMSWRKRFKSQHGSLVEFLRNNSELFVYNDDARWVSLRSAVPVDVEQSAIVISSSDQSPDAEESIVLANGVTGNGGDETISDENSSFKHGLVLPSAGHCWFDFNDANVSPIHESNIEKQFSGKECAYMLFYRHCSSSPCSVESRQMPDALIEEINAMNCELATQREEYEKVMNVISVEIHFGRSYEFRDGILCPQIGCCHFIEHVIDRRSLVKELVTAVEELGGELVENHRTIHVAKDLPVGGLHLYQEVTSDLSATLASFGIMQSTKLFVWNGKEIGGVPVSVGCEGEPISLVIELENNDTFTKCFRKNGVVGDLMAEIAKRLGKGLSSISVQRQGKHSNTSMVITLDDSRKTFSRMGFQTNDRILVTTSTLQTQTSAESVQECDPCCSPASVPATKLTFHIENHIGDDLTFFDVTVESEASIEELKVIALTSADIPFEMLSKVRLRPRLDELDLNGLGPPLHETISLSSAKLADGTHIVLECGEPPQPTEVMLTVSVKPNASIEVLVDSTLSVQQLVQRVLVEANIESGEWHLCREDWTGETGAVLDEPEQTVGDSHLNHGDHLFLQPGCPPPRGFLKIYVHLLSSAVQPCWWDPTADGYRILSPDPVGSLVISKNCTLSELKQQLTTLDVLVGFSVVTPLMFRVWSLSRSLKPEAILRQHSLTLHKLKVTNGCFVAVELLQCEEDLGVNQLVLVVRRRIPGQRLYNDCPLEVIWDMSQGATFRSLRHTVASAVGEPESAVCIAKHLPDKGDWIIISEVGGMQNGQVKGKKRKKKKGPQSKTATSQCDLRLSPYLLHDGDTIGVTNAEEAGDEDFRTAEDDAVRELLQQKQMEVDAQREEIKRSRVETKCVRNNRPEVAIKIHVDDFR